MPFNQHSAIGNQQLAQVTGKRHSVFVDRNRELIAGDPGVGGSLGSGDVAAQATRVINRPVPVPLHSEDIGGDLLRRRHCHHQYLRNATERALVD